ncbi:hypothetical protein C7S18_09350 [Ahniella affigens]|uniref:Molybdopterin molybdenumtransferase n=1 Tax=Ahniella affigens TaxID=2021234 RepID=A0A2P1PRB2_9GAMM|nr:molybdopterin molybdotransferase MoeA [Ahniella affigens]AVP97387.1 hypothetical protein C7S18_09350 [Ahniella affigens]
MWVDPNAAPPKPIPYAEARTRLETLAAALPRPVVSRPVIECLGRTLAESVAAPAAVPGFRHSAMDGYALPATAAPFQTGQVFKIGGAATAGQATPVVAADAAMAVATGGMVPEAFGAVVPKEQVQVTGDTLALCADIAQDANIRGADDDFAAGDPIATAGDKLDAVLLATLCTAGVQTINVWEPPRVAILVTGDEIQPFGSVLKPGHRIDSNGPLLASWAAASGFTFTIAGPSRDDPEQLRAQLSALAMSHELLIVTGGASVGPADFTPRLFGELGQIAFWRVAVRPGMPVVAARIGDSLALGLPGNPVAVVAGLFAFVGPIIRTWFGMRDPEPSPARLDRAIGKSHARLEWRRGYWYVDATGQARVRPIDKVSSGAMQSVAQANVLIELRAEQEHWDSDALVPTHRIRMEI